MRKPAGESTIETYCVLPSQWEAGVPHAAVPYDGGLALCGSSPSWFVVAGWRWLMPCLRMSVEVDTQSLRVKFSQH